VKRRNDLRKLISKQSKKLKKLEFKLKEYIMKNDNLQNKIYKQILKKIELLELRDEFNDLVDSLKFKKKNVEAS